MKAPISVVLFTALCLLGCSREGGASKSGTQRLVPATAAEVAASPDFKLEFTTKSGIRCYARALTREVARSIPDRSSDLEFLEGAERGHVLVGSTNLQPLLWVPIRDGKMVGWHELYSPDTVEMAGFLVKKRLSEKGMLRE